MIKIKDNVPLKELENYGFCRNGDFYSYEIDSTSVIIDIETRKIEIDFELGFYEINEYNDLLFELIKSDMVEKVVKRMCENARKCDYCHKPSSDFVLANITASEKRISIWLCYECYQKLFKNRPNGEK